MYFSICYRHFHYVIVAPKFAAVSDDESVVGKVMELQRSTDHIKRLNKNSLSQNNYLFVLADVPLA